MKAIFFSVLAAVTIVAQASADNQKPKEINLLCGIATEVGHYYSDTIKLVAGMVTDLPIKRGNVEARLNYNDLYDYVTLEAWEKTSGVVAKTEAYGISKGGQVLLTVSNAKQKSLYFHFSCRVKQ